MSRDAADPYAFGDALSLNPVHPGSTVLVSGEGFSAAEDLARSLVVGGLSNDEGALFISTNKTHAKLLSACRRTRPSVDTSQIGIIDCTGQERGQAAADARVKYVSTQSDLTGIGM